MKPFDIAPSGLPNCPAGEIRFEDPRDVERVVVRFAGPAPKRPVLQYLRSAWPQDRWEYPQDADLQQPARFGWRRMDDWFNTKWVDAAVQVAWVAPKTAVLTFKRLRAETPDFSGASEYDVAFRRTLGVRLVAGEATIRDMRVFTRSPSARTLLRVELDAGRRTPGKGIRVSGYNAHIRRIAVGSGTAEDGPNAIRLRPARRRGFELDVEHMIPAHRYSHDEGHVTFELDKEVFTISLASLQAEGPIWFAEQGVYIASADDETTFQQYKARIAGCKTIAQRVATHPEQSLAGARHGQPRSHPVPYVLGCKCARQKFWLEANGDIVLTSWVVTRQPAGDTARWKNKANGRFHFGLDRWVVDARFNDPWPIVSYNIHRKCDHLLLQQKCFAVPLLRSILDGEPAADDTMVALMRFRFENSGPEPVTAELPLEYSSQSTKSDNRRLEPAAGRRWQDDSLVPLAPWDPLRVDGQTVLSDHEGQAVVRCSFDTTMRVEQTGQGLWFRQELAPGQSCEVLLRVPYVAVETAGERAALARLDFDRCYREMRQSWRREASRGTCIHTPEPRLNAVYAGHLPMVLLSDFGFADDSGLVNTSAGAAAYGNYTNESCMILDELDQRGLVEEVRRRLAVWVRYQGTRKLLGNFTDCDGVLFGAGGLESGDSYNQHHGWALWYLSRHYLRTGDNAWFAGVVEAVVAGAEWVFRQRQNTQQSLPHSRGWERGFLPAGSLEDVSDYFYWLSTNTFTWRGVDTAGRALEAFGHPQGARICREAQAYRRDLIRGFETARQHAPLIRLRDGRWVPHYPSRLYRRGRDYGWIREVLEGSINLLISGLYKANSKQGQWILDDYQDTRYMNPPFGYAMVHPDGEWFDCGGFSIQPNLLAGLLPYLDRDEPEVYLWMFFNAFAACYREETNSLVEHPTPVLGFSNSASIKTSDQANAMQWLCRMYVYEQEDLLHLGRAIPRNWFASQERFFAKDVATRFGKASVSYRSDPAAGTLTAQIGLSLRQQPERILLRFRHPKALPVREVRVDGREHRAFDPVKGDVDLTGAAASTMVTVCY